MHLIATASIALFFGIWGCGGALCSTFSEERNKLIETLEDIVEEFENFQPVEPGVLVGSSSSTGAPHITTRENPADVPPLGPEQLVEKSSLPESLNAAVHVDVVSNSLITEPEKLVEDLSPPKSLNSPVQVNESDLEPIESEQQGLFNTAAIKEEGDLGSSPPSEQPISSKLNDLNDELKTLIISIVNGLGTYKSIQEARSIIRPYTEYNCTSYDDCLKTLITRLYELLMFLNSYDGNFEHGYTYDQVYPNELAVLVYVDNRVALDKNKAKWAQELRETFQHLDEIHVPNHGLATDTFFGSLSKEEQIEGLKGISKSSNLLDQLFDIRSDNDLKIWFETIEGKFPIFSELIEQDPILTLLEANIANMDITLYGLGLDLVKLVRLLEAVQLFIHMTNLTVYYPIRDFKEANPEEITLFLVDNVLFRSMTIPPGLEKLLIFEELLRKLVQKVMAHDCTVDFTAMDQVINICNAFRNVDLWAILTNFSKATYMGCTDPDYGLSKEECAKTKNIALSKFVDSSPNFNQLFAQIRLDTFTKSTGRIGGSIMRSIAKDSFYLKINPQESEQLYYRMSDRMLVLLLRLFEIIQFKLDNHESTSKNSLANFDHRFLMMSDVALALYMKWPTWKILTTDMLADLQWRLVLSIREYFAFFPLHQKIIDLVGSKPKTPTEIGWLTVLKDPNMDLAQVIFFETPEDIIGWLQSVRKLVVQFGSSQEIFPIENDELYLKLISIHTNPDNQLKENIILSVMLFRLFEAVQWLLHHVDVQVISPIFNLDDPKVQPLWRFFLNDFILQIPKINVHVFEYVETILVDTLYQVLGKNCPETVPTNKVTELCKQVKIIDPELNTFPPLPLKLDHGTLKVEDAEEGFLPRKDLLSQSFYMFWEGDLDKRERIKKHIKIYTRINNPNYNPSVIYSQSHVTSPYIATPSVVLLKTGIEHGLFVNIRSSSLLDSLYSNISDWDNSNPNLLLATIKHHATQLFLAITALHKIDLMYNIAQNDILVDDNGGLVIYNFESSEFLKGQAKSYKPEYYFYCAPEMILHGQSYDISSNWFGYGLYLHFLFDNSDRDYFSIYSDIMSKLEYIDDEEELTRATQDGINASKNKHAEICANASGSVFSELRDLMCQLINPDITIRLKDPEKIKSHPFFKNVNWEQYENGTAEAPEEVKQLVTKLPRLNLNLANTGL